METARPWWQSTTIYQIYPRSFQDSNGDGVGDLRGIIARLDALVALGIETIWISPFYCSPQADFGYDISDYQDIDPLFGQLADAEALIAAAHARGLKIVFDMVMNHTSDQHPWFLASSQSQDNPYADWYIWRDGKGPAGRKAPTNWESLVGGNGWQYVPARKQWYFASFLPFQPDLNYRNPAVRAAMMDVVRFWLAKGVDGFRLDIFNVIMKAADFSDNPFSFHYIPTTDGMHATFQRRSNTVNISDNFELARELRAVIDEFPDRFLVGEVFGAHAAISQYLGQNNDGLNLIFLFDMLHVKWRPSFFRARLAAYERYYPAPKCPTFVLGNHDNMRSISRIGGDLNKAKLLALLQMSTRGVPVIYYGEEIGMLDARIPKSEAQDPISHRYNWVPEWLRQQLPVALNRDICRSPMQWDDSAHAGFCPPSARPWLPLSGDLARRNVAAQMADPESLWQVYSRLLALRKSAAILRQGSLELIPAQQLPRAVLGYRRVLGAATYLILVNFSQRAQKLDLPLGHYAVVFQLGKIEGPSAVDGRLELSGLAGVILALDNPA